MHKKGPGVSNPLCCWGGASDSEVLQQTAFLLRSAVFLWRRRKNADDSGAELLTVTVKRKHAHMEGGGGCTGEEEQR